MKRLLDALLDSRTPYMTYLVMFAVVLWALVLGIYLGIAVGSALEAGPEAEPEPVAPVAAAPVRLSRPVDQIREIPKMVEEPEEVEEPEQTSLGEFKITHYCPCPKCCGQWADGITSTGTTATEGRTIAVDPEVIPYGSEVVLVYADGTEATYIAEDCGGAIKDNRIDVYMSSHQAALDAGVKYAEVLINE